MKKLLIRSQQVHITRNWYIIFKEYVDVLKANLQPVYWALL
jgi:hypothetical protein